MKKTRVSILCALLLAATGAAAEGLSDSPALSWQGTVAEVLAGGRYTYLLMNTGTDRVWVACYQVEAKVGDAVTVGEGRMMKDFESPSLKRTFDRVIFASRIQVGDQAASAEKKLPPGHPPLGGAGAGAHGGDPHGGARAAAAAPGEVLRGEVLETMDAGGYTYVQVRTKTETLWAAASKFAVAKGDRVLMGAGTVMKDFESPTLNRKFDAIHFVDRIRVDDGTAPALPPGHP